MRPKGIVLVKSTMSVGGACLDSTHAPSLYPVANRAIISHVLEALALAGIEEIAVLAPTSALEEVKARIGDKDSHRADICYLNHDRNADPAKTLRAIARFADGAPTVLHRAEGVLGHPLRPYLDLLGGEEPDAVLLVAQGSHGSEPLRSATQRALRLVEIDPAKAPFGLAGACVLSSGGLAELRSRGLAELRSGATPPCSLRLSELVEWIIAAGLSRPQVRVVGSWHAFTGDPADLLDVNRSVLERLEANGAAPAQTENSIEGRVAIDPSATVAASVISGPVVIGADAQITNSYIGPYTSVGERACIEGAEIERSIVFAGANILHIGGRLVTSVVGRDARIFRDFSVPRAMRMHVGDGAEVALC